MEIYSTVSNRPLVQWSGDYTKPFGGYYAVSRIGVTFNEGAGPLNFTIKWRDGLFLYFFCKGRRWTRHFGGKTVRKV